jgi:hypothetical protein
MSSVTCHRALSSDKMRARSPPVEVRHLSGRPEQAVRSLSARICGGEGIELPDLDMTVRALAAAGPAWPALQRAGPDRFAEAVREALRPLYVERLGVRIVSEFGWITGTVPGA